MTHTVLWRRGRLKVIFEPRNTVVGVLVDGCSVVICPLPCLIIRWSRAHPAHWRAGRSR